MVKKAFVDIQILFIKIAFFLNLRRIFIKLSRIIRENDKEKSEIPCFENPDQVQIHLSKTKYHRDPFKGKWDYVSSAEHMQYKIETHNYDKFPEGPYLGDCDDYAFMAARLLVNVPYVGEAKLVSISYTGGAHAVCIFHYKRKIFMYDYGMMEVNSLKDAVNLVAKKYSKDKDEHSKFYVLEDVFRSDEMPVYNSVFRGF